MMLYRLVFLLFPALLASTAAVAVNLEKGKEINGTCAACHGDQGAGGKKGEYPRIAGQRVDYIEGQLRNFRSRTRVNIPMFPYTQERELSDRTSRTSPPIWPASSCPTGCRPTPARKTR